MTPFRYGVLWMLGLSAFAIVMAWLIFRAIGI